jgi:S-adenosylmethionine-diacylgycerolhomoserine-N-methlytransferase
LPQSHSALMDNVYRNQRYIYDLTRKYYLFGRDRLIGELDLKPGETLAEIGCGTARNLISIARRYPDSPLYGLDASAEMLKTAASAIGRAGFSDRIGLAHGYAERLTPALFGLSKPLDRIVFSYSLSMIPDWRGALFAAQAALAPEGRVHVVDFGDLTGLPPLGARLLKRWLAQFHVAPREALLQAFEAGAAAPHRRLKILPGRYGFLLTMGRDDPLCGTV